MATIQKRGISLLLVLVLILGMIPSVYAAEVSTEPSTEPSAQTTIPVTEETQAMETSPPETTQPEETSPPETTQPEETSPPETTQPEESTPAETTPSETEPAEETEPVEEPSTELEEDMGINEIATFSIANCPSATWATIWVNTDEYSSIAGKTNRFIYYEFPAGTAKNRNNVGLKAIKVDGAWQAAYCLEPGIAEGSKYNTEEMTKDEFLSSSVVPNTLSIAQLEAMCIAALYGQHTLPQSSNYEDLSNMVATQIIIWEIAIGWRDCYPPYAQTNDAFIRRFKHGYGVGPEATSSYITIGGRLQTVIDCYNEISSNMAAHDESILSFASRSSSRAPTIELSPDGTGKYSATVTDTNGVLSDFSFTNTSKLKFTKNGNKLTITASEQVKDIMIAPTKQMADANNHIYFVWHNGSYQVMLATPNQPSYDPVPAYFYVTTPELKSSLDLAKTTEDGKNLSNWSFGIYSDSGCTNLISGPHTTDTNGKISVGNLTAGTVYVKELGHKDNSINSLYTCASTNPQRVVLVAGETATVSFHNKLNTGSVKLVKETSCGEHLAGWQIGLYTDAACTKAVSGSPFTTGEDGSVTVYDLSVGTLYAKEIPVDDPYWVCDPEVKTITIEAGETATVTFHNTHYGNIRIGKNAVNGSAEGWSFQILDAERNAVDTVNSGADGYAYSNMLLPGQYFIREIHDRDDTYWEYDAVVEKKVSVTAGSQVEVTYTNTQYGKIQIQKSMPDGGSLDGWQFRITDASGKEIEGSPFTTNASGLILTGKLQPGEYTVKEIIPEDSFYYCTSENPQTITVKAGETAQVSFTNAMRTGSITIEKVDSRGEPLAGAKFLLQWSEDGSLWWPIEYSETLGEGKCSNPNIEDGCLTSGKDGLLEWTDLHPGLYYRVTELEAPDGYTLLSEPAFEGQLPSKELTVSLRVVNCEIFTLPQTGSSAAAFFRISQLLCICVCSILLIHSYRKEHKK